MQQWVECESCEGVEFNGVSWSPLPRVQYCWDYGKVWREIQESPDDELGLVRQLVQTDLFFIVNFVLKVPRANHLFVVDACREVQCGAVTNTLDVWAREHFKAVSVDEPVPTPSGWVKHGDLKSGDVVFSPSGIPVKVVGRSRVFHETCYRVTFSDGYSVVVNGDHLWRVGRKSRRRISGTKNKRHYRDYSVMKTSQLYQHDHKPDNRYSVPITEPIQCPVVDLPLHPYVLGAWLGDGTSSCGQITSDDPEVIGRIRDVGFEVVKNKARFMYGIRGLAAHLRRAGVLNNKHIPVKYLRASESQRWELLRGLMDTDGTCNSRGTATFTNINEALVDGIFELAQSLGLSPSKRKHRSSVNGQPYIFFQVSFQSYLARPVFSIQRKLQRGKVGQRVCRDKFIVSVEKLDEIVPTSCIKVDSPDGLYLIGTHFTCTHNTTILSIAEPIQKVLNNPECTVGIFSYAQAPALSILRSIKTVLEQSELLRKCFPDVLYNDPRTEAPTWSEDKGLIVKRKSYQKESSFEAHGLIDGMPTGKHFSHRVYDDVVTEKIVPPNATPETMEKVKYAFDLSENLGAEGGTSRVVGTFYHHEDPLVYIANKVDHFGNPVFSVRRKPATLDGSFGAPSVFLSEERLTILRTNRRAFACQQLLDPTPGELQELSPEHLVFVDPGEIPQRLFKFMVVDFAGVNKNRPGDAWACHLVGVDPKLDDLGGSDLYLLDSFVDAADMGTALSRIVEMYCRAGVVWEVGVEKVGATTMEVHVKNALIARGRHGAVVKTLNPSGRKKEWRISQGLEWPLRNGKIKVSRACPIGAVDRLKMEMKRFPAWHDDALDALSYVYDLLREFPFAKKRAVVKDDDKYKRKSSWSLDRIFDSDKPWAYV